MIGRVRDSLFLTLAGIALSGMLVACGGGDDGGPGPQPPPPPPPPDDEVDVATIVGAIEAPFLATLPRVRLGAPPRPGAGAQDEPPADSIFAGTPRANGNISFEGPGKPISNDAESYELPDVPSGRKRLVIAVLQDTIIDGEQPHIGRVLAYARTTPGGTVTNEPMTHETTLEGGVAMAAELGEHTAPRGLINNPQIGLVHRYSEETARKAATTRSALNAMRPAYRQGQMAFIKGLEGLGVDYSDSLAINTDLRDQAAQPYAEARAGGTPTQEAHEQFIDNALDVYQARFENDRAHSIAWGLFGTLYDSRLVQSGGLTEGLRLESAQNLLNISVQASKKLVAATDAPDAQKTAVNDALDDILADAMAATTMDELKTAVSEGRASGVAALEEALGQDVDEAAADLKASIDLSQNPQTIGFNLEANYITPLEDAVSDPAVQDLLIALMGGPGYTEQTEEQ